MLTVIAPVYLPSYPVLTLLPSLLAQTDEDWEAILIHDGPAPTWEWLIKTFPDPRVRYRSSRERIGNWGHSLRAAAIEEQLNGRYVWLSNGDNYACPDLVSRVNRETADVVAFPILHNTYDYTLLHPSLELGHIDLCQLAVRVDLVKEIGFPWLHHSADFLWVQELAKRTSSWVFLDSALAVHN